jgi:hypothetical protein
VRARWRELKHPSTAMPRPIEEMGAPAVVRAGLMRMKPFVNAEK